MAEKRLSNVDRWLEPETPRVRKALESASRYFDSNDNLTVNTLEAVYGQESSFGTLLGRRGAAGAAGHFRLEAETAKRYGLSVSKDNDQRFAIEYAASAAARYLKDLHSMFSTPTRLSEGKHTIPIRNDSERKTFVFAAYNGGEGRIASAQRLAKQDGKNPQAWRDVALFLESARATPAKAKEIRDYVELVPAYEMEFAKKSPANKRLKQKKVPKTERVRCSEGHWRTIDDRPVFICD